MKRIDDLSPYKTVLPYASEIFGIYQPLIGWSSKRQQERLDRGFGNDLKSATNGLLSKFTPVLDVKVVEDGRIAEIGDVDVATLDISRVRSTATLLTDAIAAELPPLERYDEGVWDRLEPDRLRDILRSSVVPEVEAWQRMQLQTRQSTDTAAQVGVHSPVNRRWRAYSCISRRTSSSTH